MRGRSWRAGLGLAMLLSACAGNPQPGDTGYAYNVNGEYAAEFVTDDGTVITGTMRLATAAGGVVSGAMALDNPFTIEGEVEGLVVGSELTVTVPYMIAETGCAGVAVGGGEITEGGRSVVGSVEIEDECGEGPSTATFTLSLP